MCKHSFADFEVWNKESKILKDTAVSYYRNYKNICEDRKNSILICGQVGSGKTHISVALALNFLQQKIKVVYMPYRDVITKIKGKVNESDINIMFEIVNYRYLNYKPMIVSSEYTVDMLLAFDEGIGSRIYEMSKSYTVEISKDISNNYRLR